MCVESVHGVKAQDRYEELVLWTKGKAQVLVISFHDFDEVSVLCTISVTMNILQRILYH